MFVVSITGNFRFTTSYNTKNKRYFARHIILFKINRDGGITTIEDFEKRKL
jgi:hypothetical protein